MTDSLTPSNMVFNALAEGDCLGMDRLAEMLPLLSRQKISAAARVMVGRGWAERIEAGCFRLTAEGRRAHAAGEVIKYGSNNPKQYNRPRRKTLASRLWRAMRLTGKFTLNSLLELAGRGETNQIYSARVFVRALERAGYIQRLPRREPGFSPNSRGYLRWHLIKDTGHLTPMVRRKGMLFDPNLGEDVPYVRPMEGDAEGAV